MEREEGDSRGQRQRDGEGGVQNGGGLGGRRMKQNLKNIPHTPAMTHQQACVSQRGPWIKCLDTSVPVYLARVTVHNLAFCIVVK